MKFWVGVTDKSWFDFLASKPSIDEVNFWQPSGDTGFRAIQPWESFLFKLHSPLNFIVGGGLFVKYSQLPLSIAWETFQEKNGAGDFQSFRERILHYQQNTSRHFVPDPFIGCIVLTNPFFFKKEDWIPVPENWSANIVRGKTYDTEDPIGSSLWEKVDERIKGINPVQDNNILQVEVKEPRYGGEYLTRPRLGQGAFRVVVIDAYNRRCAITGERTLPALESAHIKPYASSGPHCINNGILLRSDLHKLFDAGYMTINTDLRVEVSKYIKEEYENGHDYYALHGKKLTNLPSDPLDQPSKKYLEWHNKEVYER